MISRPLGTPDPRTDGVDERHEVRSPIDGSLLKTVSLASETEIRRRIEAFVETRPPISIREALDILRRLGAELAARRSDFVEATIQETGFIARDSEDTIDGAIEFLTTFDRFVGEREVTQPRIPHSYLHPSKREMTIERRPFRCVSALVPQNASLTLVLTILAAALHAGSRVVVRPSLQCAATAQLLREALERCGAGATPLLLVDGKASDFLAACFASKDVDLVHYIGSNSHAEAVFLGAFQARKSCLLDGQGNGLLYVDGSFPLDEAVRLIAAGATRYNGATCTSINGVLIEARIYPALRARLVERFRALRVGHPADANTEIGPLFSTKQAQALDESLHAARRRLCGGHVSGGYFEPAVVEGVARESSLVREGFLGPAIWLQPVEDDDIVAWIRANAFPLSDTILSHREDLVRTFAAGSTAPRVTVNEDPSIESMFEPWGGFPSNWNPVSLWSDKYRQAYQLDGCGRALHAGAIGRAGPLGAPELADRIGV